MFTARMIAGVCAGLVAVVGVTGCSSSDDDNQHTEQAQPDTTSAPEADWFDYSGIQLPRGKQGPHTVDPVRYGYEHSPQGAVLAAINTQAQMALADEKTYPAVSRHSLAPSTGRDQWVQGRSLAEVHGDLEAEHAPQFTGFRIDNYTDTDALVILAADYPEVGLMAYPVQLTWISGDWRVVPAPQDAGIAPVGIDNLDGFTTFSADDTSTPTEQEK
ncbi:hypothetical protein V6758_13915 [Corynebacterium kalidii]